MTLERAGMPLVSPAELPARVAEAFRASGASGARIALESREEIVDDGSIPFVVRVLTRRVLTRRDQANALRAKAAPESSGGAGAPAPRSPFLPPYDPDLLVGAISPTHLCLLNKYNVVDRHLLIVTRDFEEQESLLDAADLRAARLCLDALDGVAFYNSGAAAGASQSHKHLQLVPFPLGPGDHRFPLDRALASALDAGLDRLAALPFRHRVLPLAAGREEASYGELVTGFGLDRGHGSKLSPYNLLMTRDWMLVVPRSRAATGPLEVNALGIAGTLIAGGDQDLAMVRATGPLEILRRVAVPW